ncbi:MAG TPA: maltotransferase domain-containing protein [Actinomycetota bacterium]|nr:maltotransferase domain-containing protein [Actinomycetota bacterium]
MRSYVRRGHVVVENVRPRVDCGRYRAKAVTGDLVEVSADVFRDGPAVVRAVVRYRGPGGGRWHEAPMHDEGNDRYVGAFRPTEIGRWQYTVEAWSDRFETWRRDLLKRVDAGQDVDLELEEGAQMIEARMPAMPAGTRPAIRRALETIRGAPAPGAGRGRHDPRVAAAVGELVADTMARHPDRRGSTTLRPVLELTVDRERARFGAWYEFFPRSAGTTTEHGTFRTAAKLLGYVAELGFDVVYLPPIHPIGVTHRKGKNNALEAAPDDVGSPWAIGSEHGGHTAVHPQLGTLDDFDYFVAEAERAGIEVALDFAIQCSPDHPWVREHPEWFQHRPDGSIRYAENPPKKYQDIYPIDFDTADREGLWRELKAVLDHWIAHGVKIFRVDNPHTKSFAFWEWCIEAIHSEHPDVVFLAEAFTRPKVMKALAKLGFTQSYTYFTWRNTKWELTEYLTELAHTDSADYFRPNFFANTPDILHEYLQKGGPPAFKIRVALAALLSPSYGIYSGYEHFENTPVREGSEEYLHSEKYELKPRDWDPRRGLAPYIARINAIRRAHPALSGLTNLRWHGVDKDSLLAFSKRSPDGDTILVVVNLNPFHWEEGTVSLDLDALGVEPGAPFEVHDLVTGSSYLWHGPHNYVRLDPFGEPAHVFHVKA